MKGLAWKIALMTAVLAVGFLVILQAQRGMTQAMLQKSGDAQGTAQASATAPESAAPDVTPPSATPAHDTVVSTTSPPSTDPFGDPASAGDSSSRVGVVKPTPIAADVPAGDPAKSAEKPRVAADSPPATAANDPFAEGGDARHSAANSAAPLPTNGKSAAAAASDVKQASASSDASSKGPDPTSGAPALPAPGADGKPGDLRSPDSKSIDAGGPPKQSEPPTGPQLEPPPDQKGTEQKPPDQHAADQKPSQGSQSPDAGPALDLPPTGTTSPSQPPSKSGSASPGFPDFGDAPTAPPPHSQPGQRPAEKPGASDVAGGPSPITPKPFPEEGPKEAPLPTPALPTPNAGSASEGSTAGGPANGSSTNGAVANTSASGSVPTGPVLDLTPSSSTSSSSTPSSSSTSTTPALNGLETKSADSSNASASPRPTAETPSEGASDFQGDGTVGDAAPLGQQRPQLSIEKVAPPNALIGHPLIYSIFVRNVGQSAARDVVVEDRIPKGTKLSGTIPRAELTGKKLIWRIGNLGGGEQRKISIRVIPQEAGEIGSVATVNFVAEAAAETVVTAPRLEFKISAPSAARLGEVVPVRFEVRNVGTGEARNVVIRDLIPPGLSHGAGNDLEYEVGRLPPGRFKQLTLDLKAGKVGTAVNRAVVLAEGGLTVEAKAAIEISGSKIALSRTGSQRCYLGRQALFTNTLVNESSFPVDGVVLVESVPAGMEFAGASHGGQYNDGSHTIAWRLDQMAPGETRVVKSRLLARGLGNQTSTVRLTVPNGEPVETSSQTAVEGFAALGLDVSGVDGPVDVGEKITLHVNARNKGTVPVTNLIVTVDVPEQMEVVSARGPGKTVQESGRLKFGPMPTLEGRTSAACEIVLSAKKRGDSRVRMSVQADQIDKPLAREESILILQESSEPSASR
jgi:uncharacterized repeat protein (TIGR01451 family)